MRSFAFFVFAAVVAVCLDVASSDTTADQRVALKWDSGVKVNATPTLSFSPNPLLAGNIGGFVHVPDNVTNNLWNYFKALNATNVRYSPVFYFPRYGSIAVDGVYNVTFFKPVLKRFMDCVGNNSVVMNLATLPSEFFSPNVSEVPEDPTVACWDYVNGGSVSAEMAGIKQYMKDTFDYVLRGHISNTSKLPDIGEAYNVTYWEVLNENEHCISDKYVSLYDEIVDYGKKATGINKPIFVALGGDSASKLQDILANSKQTLEAISLHHRSKSVSHENIGTYEDFFKEVDAFLNRLEGDVTAHLDSYKHDVSILVDSVATLLPKDREMVDTDGSGSVPIPDMYWMASGASFVYSYLKLATNRRVKSVGMGLYSAHPINKAWGVSSPMYPSLSMTNWTNGMPNARYWAVKLLIDYMPQQQTVIYDNSDLTWSDEPVPYFCARSSSRDGYPTINLSCTNLDNLAIQDANHGIISGVCGDFVVTGCRDPGDHSVYDVFVAECANKGDCSVPYEKFNWPDKCSDQLEDVVVRATCGSSAPTGTAGMTCQNQLYIVPFMVGLNHRVIIVNTRSTGTAFALSAGYTTPDSFVVVTLKSDNDMSKGYEIVTVDSSSPITVPPFSVVVVLLDEAQ